MYLLTIGACCTYSKVTALSVILRRYWTGEAVPSDQYERWWEINQNGALVDACFLADPATFNFKRTEVTATSSALLRPEAKKLVDGLLLFADMGGLVGPWPELLCMETSRKDNEDHARSNVIKLAHELRFAVALRLDYNCTEPVFGIIAAGMLSNRFWLFLLIHSRPNTVSLSIRAAVAGFLLHAAP